MANNNLDIGFLFLYEWIPAFESLAPKDFKELFLALIRKQKCGEELPEFKNAQANIYASMIAPVINRRIAGKANVEKRYRNNSEELEESDGNSCADEVGAMTANNECATVGTIIAPMTAPMTDAIIVREEKRRDIYNTTTTAGARAYAREENADMKPPSYVHIYLRMKSLGVQYSAGEAELFEAYNAKRGWDCLPNWEGAVDLWVARKEQRDREADR